MGTVRSGTSIIQIGKLPKVVCFPAQIEIFTDSENSNRTNNPRKDSNIFVVLSFTSYGKMKLFTVALILCLQAGSLLGVAVPEFHNVMLKSPSMAKHFLANQHDSQSKMSDGVMYLANHRSGAAENVIAEVLQETLKKYDSRFSQGVSAYWTFQIRIARKNKGSKFHSYAKSLPTGIQTIKRSVPKDVMGGSGDKVFTWHDVAEKKVIVY